MGKGRAIDHVVLAVQDLDQAAATYETLGFTLTPRARHEDRMGTSNRLVQFAGQNFIELLEVDRPHLLAPHDLAATPPRFSFGAACRDGAALRDGVALLVFASTDARTDIRAFEAAGLQTYAPFDFERQAGLPDGSTVTVSFSLGFATSPEMPHAPCFVCENRAPEHFWKPDFQRHANGAAGIAAVYLTSPAPERDARFLGRLFGGEISPFGAGFSIACGHGAVRVLPPEAMARIAPGTALPPDQGAVFSGISLDAPADFPAIASTEGCGMFMIPEHTVQS